MHLVVIYHTFARGKDGKKRRAIWPYFWSCPHDLLGHRPLYQAQGLPATTGGDSLMKKEPLLL